MSFFLWNLNYPLSINWLNIYHFSTTGSDKNAVKVVYKPNHEGEHKIFIKFDGFQIKGSPFKVQVRGRAPWLSLEEKVILNDISINW
jgi:hypothetical protein